MQRFILCFFIVFSIQIKAQICTLPGQTPATAIPVCGNGLYNQPDLTPCVNNSVFVPGCTDERTSYTDNNPFYYKFTCKSPGSFAFIITPVRQQDDYDWQLFDITGHTPEDIFTRYNTTVVAANWSGSHGATGTSSDGIDYIQCRSDPFFEEKPLFHSTPQLISGHNYILLVRHTENFIGGYSIFFGGGTADISSSAEQQIQVTSASCDKRQIILKFSNRIICNTIAADGSDFRLNFSSSILNATPINCMGNSTDSVRLMLQEPLAADKYLLTIKKGNDDNTLIDECNIALNENTVVPVNLVQNQLPDSILVPLCNPQEISFPLNDLLCNTIADDGSDFKISGPENVVIESAGITCVANKTTGIKLILKNPIQSAGTYLINIKAGTDGNTLINQCNDAIKAGSAIKFVVESKAGANFTYSLHEGCRIDTLNLFTETNIQQKIKWFFDTLQTLDKSPVIYVSSSGEKTVRAIVGEGACADSSQQIIPFKEKLNADFISPEQVCPEEQITFTDASTHAISWSWIFSNGNVSSLRQPPPQQYPPLPNEKKYPVYLIVQNENCIDTSLKFITVKAGCFTGIPSAFTPNGDGINDKLGPLNTNNLKMDFSIYNRYGQMIFRTTNENKWDGTYRHVKQNAGVYLWILKYTDPNTGTEKVVKGSSILLR